MHNFYSKNEANIWSNLENAPNFLCSNWDEQRYLDWDLVRGVNAGAGALFSRFEWWLVNCSRSIKTAADISFLLSAITFYTPQPPIFAMAVTRDTWHVCPAAVMAPCSLVTSASVQTGGGGRLRSVTPFSELITALQPRPVQPPPPPQTLQPVTSNQPHAMLAVLLQLILFQHFHWHRICDS